MEALREMIHPGIVSAQGSGGGGGYVGPLDIVGGAAFAYSQRALSSALRGTALFTIRRSNDNATQSFSSDATTGVAPDAAIATFLGVANGFVTNWRDQSGHAVDVTQATVANQPGFVKTVGGVKSALSFDDTIPQGMFSALNASVLGGSCTAFYVATCSTVPGTTDLRCAFAIGSTTGLVFGSKNGDLAQGGQPYGSLGENNGCYNETVTDTLPVQNLSIIDGTIQFSGGTLRFNGVDQTMEPPFQVGHAPCDDETGPVVVGGYAVGLDDPVSFGLDWFGTLNEIIVYPGIMSDANRARVRANIAAYYGIAI